MPRPDLPASCAPAAADSAGHSGGLGPWAVHRPAAGHTPTAASCSSPTTRPATGPAWSCACRWPHPSTVPPRGQSATATRRHSRPCHHHPPLPTSPQRVAAIVSRSSKDSTAPQGAGAAFDRSCSSRGAAPEQDKRVDRAGASVAEQRADDGQGPSGVGSRPGTGVGEGGLEVGEAGVPPGGDAFPGDRPTLLANRPPLSSITMAHHWFIRLLRCLLCSQRRRLQPPAWGERSRTAVSGLACRACGRPPAGRTG